MIRHPLAVLAVLTLINLFNYIDRCVLAAVQPKIKLDLSLSDAELGLLTSAFIWVYMATSPVFGRLGDTGSRKGLIPLGVGIWSLATALGGLAQSFRQMFIARAAVGVGEAAYGTLSPAMLADSFPKTSRGRVFAVFFAAMPIGYALGYVIGGVVSGPDTDVHGWRRAFFVAGLPGILLAVIAMMLVEPARGAHDAPEGTGAGAGPGAGAAKAEAPREGAIASYLSLLGNRAYLLTVLGYAAYTFAVGGLAVWMPTFLNRVRDVPLDIANTYFGGITLAAGFIGTLGGGWIGDRLLERGVKNAYLLVSAIATLIALPACVLTLALPTPAGFYGAAFVAELLLFASTSPINSVVVNVVPVVKRAARTLALCIFTIHALGDAISPPIIGAVSDALTDPRLTPDSVFVERWLDGGHHVLKAAWQASSAAALGKAVLAVPAAVLVASLIWFAASRVRPAGEGGDERAAPPGTAGEAGAAGGSAP